MHPEPDWATLDRYAAGECAAGERTQVEAWADADPERRVLLDALVTARRRMAGHASGAGEPIWNVERAVQTLVDHVTHAPGDNVRPRWVSSRCERARWWPAAMGVSVLIVLGAGLAVKALQRGARTAPAWRQYATAAGQRLTVTLVDGTQLTLAPATRVRVAADFGRPTGVREVELLGEAYFAVVHDVAHPFVVRAHGAVARDVGTAFDVRAYPEDAEARIAVAEGMVAVAASGGAVRERPLLRAGDVATVEQSAVTVEHGVDVADLTAWRDGDLAFTKTSIRDAAAELSRWYGLDVHVDDASLGGQLVSGRFPTESIDAVLAELLPAVGARAVRVGSTITITAAHGAAR
jgi:transmembrane sensor